MILSIAFKRCVALRKPPVSCVAGGFFVPKDSSDEKFPQSLLTMRNDAHINCAF